MIERSLERQAGLKRERAEAEADARAEHNSADVVRALPAGTRGSNDAARPGGRHGSRDAGRTRAKRFCWSRTNRRSGSCSRRRLPVPGISVYEARNGQEAMKVFDQHGDSIDLLLTDMRMPFMGGAELAEQLRARRQHAEAYLCLRAIRPGPRPTLTSDFWPSRSRATTFWRRSVRYWTAGKARTMIPRSLLCRRRTTVRPAEGTAAARPTTPPLLDRRASARRHRQSVCRLRWQELGASPWPDDFRAAEIPLKTRERSGQVVGTRPVGLNR